ncbi:MAG TPA: protein TolQ [Polyangia bacterium]|jgi:biopolymer transport protein TolQ|nr:protein TolQ [Polyangia bacterium]
MHAHVLMVEAVSANAPASANSSGSLDILPLILNASGVVMGVLFLLLSLSVISWWIIGYKALFFQRAVRDSVGFIEAFWNTKRYDQLMQDSSKYERSPIAQMFRAAFVELSKVLKQHQGEQESQKPDAEAELENIERALRRSYTREMTILESLIPFLATTGSAAPFVGLFGTVWGIMNSFRSIGAKGAANLSTVAPGIAEALIATAIGLVAAIPAVMAFNFFTRKIKVLSAEMEGFSNDFLNIVKRHFLR